MRTDEEKAAMAAEVDTVKWSALAGAVSVTRQEHVLIAGLTAALLAVMTRDGSAPRDEVKAAFADMCDMFYARIAKEQHGTANVRPV